MDEYAKMKNTRENAGDIGDFAPYGEGSSEEWIKKQKMRYSILILQKILLIMNILYMNVIQKRCMQMIFSTF